MGATKYTSRTIPRISLANFSSRIDEITAQLVHAAETDGFFSLIDTEIAIADINAIFNTSASFFTLPEATKATVPFTHANVGWESNQQIRPSTGTPDMKESYQLQFGTAMTDKWISPSILPAFKTDAQIFMAKTQSLSEKLMLCFARGLSFPDDHFIRAHDATNPSAQSVLRMLHYHALDAPAPEGHYRAGAHADWDFLTLLFQLPNQSGLEICPGRSASTSFAIGDVWTQVEFAEGDIVCNIGDLLMSWSDDRFKSTFHCVRAPTEVGRDWFGERFSIAFFNQPCAEAVIQGPRGKYPVVTGREFTKRAMERNFAALEAKKEELGRKEVAV